MNTNGWDQLIDLFNKILEREESIYCYIIDTLASSYGWSIEYIQNLTVPEIVKLMKIIKQRKELEDVLMQLNVLKGFSGNISSNSTKKESKPIMEDEVKNIEILSKMFKNKKIVNGKVIV